MLVTIEGIDGAGKSTLAAALVAQLGPEAVLLREPGGVAVAEAIRELCKDPRYEVHPRTEALLFAAARAQLVHERLVPLLEAGTTVVLDRYVDSSLAYQGGGRELGVARVAELNAFAVAGVVPDRTLLLRLDPAVGAARAGGRDAAPDRMEAAGREFFARVAAAYDALAAAEPERFRILDAAQPPAAVLSDALAALI